MSKQDREDRLRREKERREEEKRKKRRQAKGGFDRYATEDMHPRPQRKRYETR